MPRIRVPLTQNLSSKAFSDNHSDRVCSLTDWLSAEASKIRQTMKVLHKVSFLLLVLMACFCTGIATKARPSYHGELVNKFKMNHPKTYKRIQDDVKAGTIKALDTCREVFKNERWNCDVSKNKLLVHKGKQMPAFFRNSLPANKEGAYLQALGSAGVMYTLTTNCRLGRYEDCACVPIDRPFASNQKWRWSGCNENLNFGETMTKYFVDQFEQRANNRRAALNLHNNEVGRKVVRSAARKTCRCHGPTASCAFKTCWRQLANFTEVGKLLKKKYDDAMRVKYENNIIKKYNSGTPVPKGRKGNLAYFDISPNYCWTDSTTGFPGMQGRACIHGNDGAKCNRMCTSCGLKFRNEVEVEKQKCRCKFVWCCHINCDTCEKQHNRTVCL